MPSTVVCFFMPLQVLTLLTPTQIHAALPRLILHLHDDDLSVRLACRVYTLWSTTFPLPHFCLNLHMLLFVVLSKTEHIPAPCTIDGSRGLVFAPQQAVFCF